jgi:prepilin-type N-terminal cleavage/methylation domain-containing protein
MKNLLPKSYSNKTKGFTLVELMVAIAIIAILSVVGVGVFTGAQRNARDARRRQDIEAFSSALDGNIAISATGVQSYTPLTTAMFASGALPTDSGNGTATYVGASATGATALPAAITVWPNTSAIPTTPATYATLAAGFPAAANTNTYIVCALLESAANATHCKTGSLR